MNPDTEPLRKPRRVATSARICDTVVPACPVCLDYTRRLTISLRVCPEGHVSRLSWGEHPSMIAGVLSERWTMIFVRMTVALLLCVVMPAEEVPQSLLRGIAFVETSSHVHGLNVDYVNRADGRNGEVGFSQISRVVCRQHHFNRERIRTDTGYAMRCTIAHLRWLHEQLGTWDLAAAWNGGLSGRNRASAIAYAARVAAAGGSL